MTKLRFIVLSCLVWSGCVNIYTRCPCTNFRIEDTYQSTKLAHDLSQIVMFPQRLNPTNDKMFIPENIVTVTIGGAICVVDLAAEACTDTVFWPIDKSIASYRAEPVFQKDEEREEITEEVVVQ